MQRFIKLYRKESGNQSVTMAEVAEYAASKGWELPKPRTGLERLAEQFAAAAREEVRRDEVTGRPYRANMAVTDYINGQQSTLWTDIDEASRPIAHKALKQRRNQMIGDAVHLAYDVEHWNRVNPGEMPIQMPLDFTDDVAEHMAADEGDNQEAA
jgi:hypothetical protein